MIERLLAEAKTTYAKAEEQPHTPDDHQEYIVEMSKLIGLFNGIIQEASLLANDSSQLIMKSQTVDIDSALESISSLFSKPKKNHN